MNKVTQPARPVNPPAAGRRGMRTGTGIFLITVGAISRFALPAGSPHPLNLHNVGVIMILAGALGLLLPRLARGLPHPDRLRRWIRPHQPRAYDEPPTGADPRVRDDPPALVQDHSAGDDPPPLVGDLRRLGESPAAPETPRYAARLQSLPAPKTAGRADRPQPEPKLSASAEAGIAGVSPPGVRSR
jgi:hypothetical protein